MKLNSLRLKQYREELESVYRRFASIGKEFGYCDFIDATQSIFEETTQTRGGALFIPYDLLSNYVASMLNITEKAKPPIVISNVETPHGIVDFIVITEHGSAVEWFKPNEEDK